MINLMHDSNKLSAMVLEGKVVVDARTLENDNQLGVYIPALQPTVGIANSAEELELSLDLNRFTTCENAAIIDSSIMAINYMIVSVMKPHNTDIPPLQEGEHVFIGFIDNDLKKPFVYPWGSTSSVRHRMRDKVRIYCSNKKTVAGELTEEHIHYFEIDSEAMTAKMHLVNSEGESVGLDINVDMGNGLWDITDTAGNTFSVVADEETPENNEMHFSNAKQCQVDLVGPNLGIKATENVTINGKNVVITAEENYEVNSKTDIHTTSDFGIDADASAVINAPDIGIEAKMDLILLGMNIKASAQVQADFLASVMQNLGVAPSAIAINPAMETHGSPIISGLGMIMAPAVVPGGTMGPPAPATPPTAPPLPPVSGVEPDDGGFGAQEATPAPPPPPPASPPPPPPGSPPPLKAINPGPASTTDTAGIPGVSMIMSDTFIEVLSTIFDSMMAVTPVGAPLPVAPLARGMLKVAKPTFTTTKTLGL